MDTTAGNSAEGSENRGILSSANQFVAHMIRADLGRRHKASPQSLGRISVTTSSYSNIYPKRHKRISYLVLSDEPILKTCLWERLSWYKMTIISVLLFLVFCIIVLYAHAERSLRHGSLFRSATKNGYRYCISPASRSCSWTTLEHCCLATRFGRLYCSFWSQYKWRVHLTVPATGCKPCLLFLDNDLHASIVLAPSHLFLCTSHQNIPDFMFIGVMYTPSAANARMFGTLACWVSWLLAQAVPPSELVSSGTESHKRSVRPREKQSSEVIVLVLN